jgi:hypothetical protein
VGVCGVYTHICMTRTCSGRSRAGGPGAAAGGRHGVLGGTVMAVLPQKQAYMFHACLSKTNSHASLPLFCHYRLQASPWLHQGLSRPSPRPAPSRLHRLQVCCATRQVHRQTLRQTTLSCNRRTLQSRTCQAAAETHQASARNVRSRKASPLYTRHRRGFGASLRRLCISPHCNRSSIAACWTRHLHPRRSFCAPRSAFESFWWRARFDVSATVRKTTESTQAAQAAHHRRHRLLLRHNGVDGALHSEGFNGPHIEHYMPGSTTLTRFRFAKL